MKFQNSSNKYIESKPAPWLMALLFGGFYFIFSGLWTAAISWLAIILAVLLLSGQAAIVIIPFICLAFSLFANGFVRQSYLSRGWVEITEDSPPEILTVRNGRIEIATPTHSEDTITPTTIAKVKKCPFCAEEILAEAIRCKHCRSDIADQPPSMEASTQNAPPPDNS